MLAAAIKLAAPVATALALALHGLVPNAGPGGLTNVTGAAGDCTAPVAAAACAPLFDGSDLIYPGHAVSRSVRIAYHGSRRVQAGLYAAAFTSRAAGSLDFCRAADPASMLDLEVTREGAVVYQGTLAAFAAAHGTGSQPLAVGSWRDGEGGTFTFTVGLDAAADNRYMGCVTRADLVWVAE